MITITKYASLTEKYSSKTVNISFYDKLQHIFTTSNRQMLHSILLLIKSSDNNDIKSKSIKSLNNNQAITHLLVKETATKNDLLKGLIHAYLVRKHLQYEISHDSSFKPGKEK